MDNAGAAGRGPPGGILPTTMEDVRSSAAQARELLAPGDDDGDLLENCCPRLSYKQRITGWAACFAVGTIISLAASHRFHRDPGAFARLYTLGNLVALSGSFFLMGPAAQLKRMLDKERRWTVFALIILFTSTITVSVLLDATKFSTRILILFLVLFQYAAMTWYTLSYIPYARSCVTNCLRGLLF
ncbi:unnamed protein product [Amoebophrya sp. A120]|nr:unnamed protein product [Amoebophrya sp. A120]|eukprot:GSA120T00006357001.1